MTWIPGQDEAGARCDNLTHWYPREPPTADCECGRTTREKRGDKYVIVARFGTLGEHPHPSEAEVRAFVAGFAISDECFSAEGQYHYEWQEVLDAYRRGGLEEWLERHRWRRALAIIRSGDVTAGRDF